MRKLINCSKTSNVKQSQCKIGEIRYNIVGGDRVSIVKGRVASKDVFYHPTRLPLHGECVEAFKAIRSVLTETTF